MGTSRGAGEIVWNGEDKVGEMTANLHSRHALIPALNDLAGAELELERVVAIARAVELLAVLVGLARVVQPAGIVHRDVLARRRRGARADLAVRNLQTRDVVHIVRSGNRVIGHTQSINSLPDYSIHPMVST